jgi:hypothetical protein
MKFKAQLIICIFCILLSRCEFNRQVIVARTDMPTIAFGFPNIPTNTLLSTPTFTETNTITVTFTPSFSPTITLSNTATYTRSSMERFIETSGEIPFSYIPPMGWLESNRGKLTSWEFGEGIRPNTIGCELTFAIMLEPNITAAEFSNRYRGPEVLGSGKFHTNAGYDAYRLSNLNRATDGNGEDTFYFITNGKYFLIAVYNRMMGGYIEQDAIVDKSIMTTQFE